MPFLTSINIDNAYETDYLFTIPVLKNGLSLQLKKNVTFFVGENGSGKSTILESVAERCEFGLTGGNKNHNQNQGVNFEGFESPLTKHVKLGWTPKKINEGFFMRAESFFNFATYIDQLAQNDSRILNAYGGKPLHQQSHGESFLSLFENQFESGIYILDEPEAALSPQRILSFMVIINQLEKSGRAQFLIATHSPILLSYPNADVFSLDDEKISKIDYRETEHYRITKSFLDNPDMFFKFLFGPNK